jgi:RimJ/RimL family protein N-acetyltransferase
MSAAHGGLKDDLRSTHGTTIRPSELVLRNIYERPDRHYILYQLLEERDETTNISHRDLPAWGDHVAFVESDPYAAWHAIEIRSSQTPFGAAFLPVGACYLSKQDEIGIHIFKAHRGKGYGWRAVKALIDKHGPRRYLANINPRNERSAEMFSRMGFKLIQHTFELAP